MDKLYIDMPSDFEIENHINSIVEKGIKKKESFYNHIKNMYKVIGFKNLFHDISELTFVGILFISIVGFFVRNIIKESYLGTEGIYAFVFMISPLLYFSTVVFSYVNIRENNTYQVEMVCKYNILQVASLRMLVFSTICILVNTILIIIIHNKIMFVKGIMISISSLFIFSTLALYALLNIKKVVIKYAVVIGWIALNGLFYIMDISIYNQVLSNIPTYIYGLVSIGSACLYMKNIKKLSGYENINFEI